MKSLLKSGIVVYIYIIYYIPLHAPLHAHNFCCFPYFPQWFLPVMARCWMPPRFASPSRSFSLAWSSARTRRTARDGWKGICLGAVFEKCWANMAFLVFLSHSSCSMEFFMFFFFNGFDVIELLLMVVYVPFHWFLMIWSWLLKRQAGASLEKRSRPTDASAIDGNPGMLTTCL